ncbi:hypothetical protein QUA56_00405 [Microcoleus sp. N3A4]
MTTVYIGKIGKIRHNLDIAPFSIRILSTGKMPVPQEENLSFVERLL